MTEPVLVLGLGADGLDSLGPRSRRRLEAATFLAGGRRHLALVGPASAETFVLANNVAELVERLRRRRPGERCVVLASGDPLCFGIGRTLLERLGADQVVVEPAVSSLQLAFARAGLGWTDAALASVHGRPRDAVLLPLLGRPKIGLLTSDGDDPARIAEFFLARGLNGYLAWVGEDLGGPGERVTRLPIRELAGARFGDLNVVILLRTDAPPDGTPPVVGIPDERFATPDSGPVLLTHADVRAVTLARFRDLPAGPIWDVGAGLGGVAVELARAFRDREVVALEREPSRVARLRENRSRFGAFNLRVVEGQAPEALAREATPAAAFLGGSGGRLDAILTLLLDRLVPGGVLVANYVGLENLALTLHRLRAARWEPDVTQLQISHAAPLAGLTTLRPQRPVWIVRSSRPARGEGTFDSP